MNPVLSSRPAPSAPAPVEPPPPAEPEPAGDGEGGRGLLARVAAAVRAAHAARVPF